jgi:hypothetical protein
MHLFLSKVQKWFKSYEITRLMYLKMLLFSHDTKKIKYAFRVSKWKDFVHIKCIL